MNNINKQVKLSVTMIVRSLSLQIQFFFSVREKFGVFKNSFAYVSVFAVGYHCT